MEKLRFQENIKHWWKKKKNLINLDNFTEM